MENPSSWWRETAPPVSLSEGPVPAETDVLVIGAGLSGLSVARRLSEAGRDVTVVDRTGVGGGASARNGGIVAPGLVDGMAAGVARSGEAAARTLLRMSWDSFRIIREVEAGAPFPLELELPGRLTLARDEEELAALHENARLLRAAGERVREAGPDEVPDPLRGAYIGGIILEGGFVHSGRLTMAFAARALAAGVRIYAPVAVDAVAREAGALTARAGPSVIRAQDVVVAVNGFSSRLLPQMPVEPARGQMVVTEPVEPVLQYAMSARGGFDYFHQRRDGRLVAGGFRDLALAAEKTDEMVLNDDIQAALTRLVTTLAGRRPEIRWRWSCIMGFTPDHLPIVGRLEEGLFVTAGFSGHGVVMTPVAGKMLADAMLGESVPELRLFSPERPALSAGRR